MIQLQPVNGRKSFYGKCNVITGKEGLEHLLYLYSYDTFVAQYNTESKELKINGWYSMTTQNHINSFLQYLGLPTMDKKSIIEYSTK